jgi:hypothetical protein
MPSRAMLKERRWNLRRKISIPTKRAPNPRPKETPMRALTMGALLDPLNSMKIVMKMTLSPTTKNLKKLIALFIFITRLDEEPLDNSFVESSCQFLRILDFSNMLTFCMLAAFSKIFVFEKLVSNLQESTYPEVP